MIDTNKYFMAMTDKGGGTIGYYVTNPSRLLLEIHKQNKQLIIKIEECKKLKEENEELKNKLRVTKND